MYPCSITKLNDLRSRREKVYKSMMEGKYIQDMYALSAESSLKTTILLDVLNSFLSIIICPTPAAPPNICIIPTRTL